PTSLQSSSIPCWHPSCLPLRPEGRTSPGAPGRAFSWKTSFVERVIGRRYWGERMCSTLRNALFAFRLLEHDQDHGSFFRAPLGRELLGAFQLFPSTTDAANCQLAVLKFVNAKGFRFLAIFLALGVELLRLFIRVHLEDGLDRLVVGLPRNGVPL